LAWALSPSIRIAILCLEESCSSAICIFFHEKY
jgi:hypothetical protein